MLRRFDDTRLNASGWRRRSAMLTPMGTHYDCVWPRSPRGVQVRRRADRVPSLDGARVAFLWDHLFRGDELFPILADELRRRFPTIEIVDHTEFGNLHGADEKVRVGRLPDDLRTRGVDAVVSGMGC